MINEQPVAAARLAGFWRRFGSSIIDGIIVGIVGGVVQFVLSQAGDSGRSLGGLLNFAISLAYYIWGYGTGQTLGCKLLGLRIVDESTGGNIGYGRALARYFGAILSTIALFIGFLWMIWDKKKQTWHDKFAKSVVINVGEAAARNQMSFSGPGAV